MDQFITAQMQLLRGLITSVQ
jgi:hypothetical protein